MAEVVIRELRFSSVDDIAWDSFAAACECSVRSTRAQLGAWRLKHIFSHQLRMFELFRRTAGGELKFAQCALGVGRDGASIFLDRLQILPKDAALWAASIKAILTTVGPGRFQYGWELNLEPPRDADLSSLPRVEIETSRPIIVQAIDFNRWSSWGEYYRTLRKGAKQSAKFAFRDMPTLALTTGVERGVLRHLPALLRLRLAASRRKGLGLRWADLAISYLACMALCPQHIVSRSAVVGDKVFSVYYGAEFGRDAYFLDSGSLAENKGAAWAVLISMIKRSYERSPSGKFIMGYVDYALHDEELGGGLLRSRAACRASDYPTSVVSFRYG